MPQAVDWPALRRVLAVRLDNLGDVIMVTPALRALRAALAPQARLDLLASPGGAALAPLLAEIDEVRVLRAAWQDAAGTLPQDPDREVALIASLRGYDAVVIFTSFAQSPHPMGYAAYLAGVPVRVGVSKEFAGSVLSHQLAAPPDGQHQSDRALALLASVGIADRGHALRLTVPDQTREKAAALRAEVGLPDGYALLAPGASCPSRRYPAERFARVAAALDRPVAVVGTDSERTLVGQVCAGTPSAVDLAGRLDVPLLAALVEGAAVAVTNNSGGMHLADALRTPVVTLFAGTEELSQFAPRSTRACVLTVPTACSPCRAFTCPYRLQCLDVDPAQVAAAAREVAA